MICWRKYILVNSNISRYIMNCDNTWYDVNWWAFTSCFGSFMHDIIIHYTGSEKVMQAGQIQVQGLATHSATCKCATKNIAICKMVKFSESDWCWDIQTDRPKGDRDIWYSPWPYSLIKAKIIEWWCVYIKLKLQDIHNKNKVKNKQSIFLSVSWTIHPKHDKWNHYTNCPYCFQFHQQGAHRVMNYVNKHSTNVFIPLTNKPPTVLNDDRCMMTTNTPGSQPYSTSDKSPLACYWWSWGTRPQGGFHNGNCRLKCSRCDSLLGLCQRDYLWLGLPWITKKIMSKSI